MKTTYPTTLLNLITPFDCVAVTRTTKNRQSGEWYPSRYFATFNGYAGQLAFDQIRPTLLKDYVISKKGRYPDRKWLSSITGISHETLRRGVPLRHASRFDVYLTPKPIKNPELVTLQKLVKKYRSETVDILNTTY